jgi:hypothetical protein
MSCAKDKGRTLHLLTDYACLGDIRWIKSDNAVLMIQCDVLLIGLSCYQSMFLI